MKGLETFSQLAQWNFDNAQYEISVGPVSIVGRLPWIYNTRLSSISSQRSSY